MKTKLLRRLGIYRIAGFLILTAWAVETAHAADYLGANGVLQEVATRTAKPAAQQPKDDLSILRDDLKSFSQASTNLAAADAAKQWLALVDRVMKIQQEQQQGNLSFGPNEQPVGAQELLAALPPPADWDELAKAIAARPPSKKGGNLLESGLRFSAATLTANTNGQMQEITALQEKARDADFQTASMDDNILQQWNQDVLAVSDEPDVILRSLDYQLDSIDKSGSQQLLQIPNLVSEVGADKAEVFLRKALVSPNIILQFQQPNDTSRLAQKLAMELITQLKLPQWGLVNSLDSVSLYEAMDKQFKDTNSTSAMPAIPGVVMPSVPSGDMGGNTMDMFKPQAEIYYMLGLISLNRSPDAVVIAKKIDASSTDIAFACNQAMQSMESAGYTAALDNFLYQLLSQNPDFSFWDGYVQTAAATGQTDRMLALVRSALARNDLTDARKAGLEQILYKALLGADHVDEGVQEIRSLVNDSVQFQGQETAGQRGVELAQIGALEKRPEWTDEGIADAEKWLKTPAGQNITGGNPGLVLSPLAEILFTLGRGPEAEAILTDALVNIDRGVIGQSQYGFTSEPSQDVLVELALIYHKAGRYNDVLKLLQQSPDWGTGDLSGLFSAGLEFGGDSVMWLHNGTPPFPVPYLAANAMIATGQKDEARKIVNELILQDPALDRGYELLLEIDGTNTIPQLDDLFQRDQFEKRPLIWKAHLLREENRLDEAEKTIRQAISIDPSDGESGRGDRMRAYAELADILDARGDTNNADSYRKIVKAIRMSEDADQFYQAGLLEHAIGMYNEALNSFSDAYCIQSRLAVQLSALGQNQAAEEHYRRAYELMPDSFGRVESHCFGCEGVFEGAQAQGIAEQVFTKIVAERPDKPQAYYLLGYLKAEEEQYNAARTSLLSAVRLDPDYLNAWKKLEEVSQQTLAPPKDRDEIVFNILRLDPLQQHDSEVNFQTVTDLRGLWNAVATAASLRPKYSTNLLALTASQAALDKKEKHDQSQQTQYEGIMMNDGLPNPNPTPGQAIAQTSFVQMAGQMMLGGNYFSGN